MGGGKTRPGNKARKQERNCFLGQLLVSADLRALIQEKVIEGLWLKLRTGFPQKLSITNLEKQRQQLSTERLS